MKPLKQLKKILEKEVGKKCKDSDPFCCVCISWRAYEALEVMLTDPPTEHFKERAK